MKFKRLIYGSLLSLSLFTTCSLFSVVAATNGVVGVYAGNECLAAEFNKVPNATYKAYVKGEDITSYQELDSHLIREVDGNIRVDALGLKAGTYNLKFVINNSEIIELTDIDVKADDRSGYAHHNYSDGIGAYNDDGTLKDNAVVVYVNNSNKNTVQATFGGNTYTGLYNILANSSSSYPIDIRVIGTIGAPAFVATKITSTMLENKKFDVKVYDSNDNELKNTLEEQHLDNVDKSKYQITKRGYGHFDNSYSELYGLRTKISYGTTTYDSKTYNKYDSYFNMMDVSSKENITIEGVGTDATIAQWGFTWKNCNYIEVKNLTFNDYQEDACSFEASDTSATTLENLKTGNLWVHNNTFNIGKNESDISFEQDKNEGDGATDFKGLKNVTVSYNHYYKNHKTGLVGGDGTHHQANFTFHHNWYEQNQARLPYGRQANMHMYNNYYDSSTGTNMQIHDGGYAFIENCYFKNTAKTFEIITNNTSQVPAVKSFNNIYDNAKYDGKYLDESILDSSISFEVPYKNLLLTKDREATISNNNFINSSFDTDSSAFYYDSENHKSNVTIMNKASEVPTVIPTVAGAGKLKTTTYTITGGSSAEPEPVIDQDPVYDNTASAYYLYEDFSVEKNIQTTNSTPTSAGIYVQTENGTYTDNYLTYDEEGLYLYDSSTSLTTIGYYMFETKNIYNSGVLKYVVEYTPKSANSSWTIVSFLADGGSFDIRSRTATTLGYTLNGSDITDVIDDFSANTKYAITLTIDYNSGTSSIDINGTKINNISYSNSIKGLKFVTSKGSERYAHVNSILITNDEISNSIKDCLKLGYQLGSYTQNNNTYYALRIIGKIEYNDVFTNLDDIESIKINIIIENANGVQTKVLNKEIDNIYKSLKLSSGTTITETGDNLRYYYTVIKGITSAHSGYKIKANTTLLLKNGVEVKCSGFVYEV